MRKNTSIASCDDAQSSEIDIKENNEIRLDMKK